MKVLLKILAIIAGMLLVLWQLAEILILPAIFVLIGVLNELPWQYYVISIVGYFLICVIIQIVCHFIFNKLEKKYTPFFERFIDKFADRFFQNRKGD